MTKKNDELISMANASRFNDQYEDTFLWQIDLMINTKILLKLKALAEYHPYIDQILHKRLSDVHATNRALSKENIFEKVSEYIKGKQIILEKNIERPDILNFLETIMILYANKDDAKSGVGAYKAIENYTGADKPDLGSLDVVKQAIALGLFTLREKNSIFSDMNQVKERALHGTEEEKESIRIAFQALGHAINESATANILSYGSDHHIYPSCEKGFIERCFMNLYNFDLPKTIEADKKIWHDFLNQDYSSALSVMVAEEIIKIRRRLSSNIFDPDGLARIMLKKIKAMKMPGEDIISMVNEKLGSDYKPISKQKDFVGREYTEDQMIKILIQLITKKLNDKIDCNAILQQIGIKETLGKPYGTIEDLLEDKIVVDKIIKNRKQKIQMVEKLAAKLEIKQQKFMDVFVQCEEIDKQINALGYDTIPSDPDGKKGFQGKLWADRFNLSDSVKHQLKEKLGITTDFNDKLDTIDNDKITEEDLKKYFARKEIDQAKLNLSPKDIPIDEAKKSLSKLAGRFGIFTNDPTWELTLSKRAEIFDNSTTTDEQEKIYDEIISNLRQKMISLFPQKSHIMLLDNIFNIRVSKVCKTMLQRGFAEISSIAENNSKISQMEQQFKETPTYKEPTLEQMLDEDSNTEVLNFLIRNPLRIVDELKALKSSVIKRGSLEFYKPIYQNGYVDIQEDLAEAVKGNSEEIALYLIDQQKKPPSFSLIRQAVISGSVRVTRALLRKKGDLKQSEFNTLMYFILENNYVRQNIDISMLEMFIDETNRHGRNYDYPFDVRNWSNDNYSLSIESQVLKAKKIQIRSVYTKDVNWVIGYLPRQVELRGYNFLEPIKAYLDRDDSTQIEPDWRVLFESYQEHNKRKRAVKLLIEEVIFRYNSRPLKGLLGEEQSIRIVDDYMLSLGIPFPIEKRKDAKIFQSEADTIMFPSTIMHHPDGPKPKKFHGNFYLEREYPEFIKRRCADLEKQLKLSKKYRPIMLASRVYNKSFEEEFKPDERLDPQSYNAYVRGVDPNCEAIIALSENSQGLKRGILAMLSTKITSISDSDDLYKVCEPEVVQKACEILDIYNEVGEDLDSFSNLGQLVGHYIKGDGLEHQHLCLNYDTEYFPQFLIDCYDNDKDLKYRFSNKDLSIYGDKLSRHIISSQSKEKKRKWLKQMFLIPMLSDPMLSEDNREVFKAINAFLNRQEGKFDLSIISKYLEQKIMGKTQDDDDWQISILYSEILLPLYKSQIEAGNSNWLKGLSSNFEKYDNYQWSEESNLICRFLKFKAIYLHESAPSNLMKEMWEVFNGTKSSLSNANITFFLKNASSLPDIPKKEIDIFIDQDSRKKWFLSKFQPLGIDEHSLGDFFEQGFASMSNDASREVAKIFNKRQTDFDNVTLKSVGGENLLFYAKKLPEFEKLSKSLDVVEAVNVIAKHLEDSNSKQVDLIRQMNDCFTFLGTQRDPNKPNEKIEEIAIKLMRHSLDRGINVDRAVINKFPEAVNIQILKAIDETGIADVELEDLYTLIGNTKDSSKKLTDIEYVLELMNKQDDMKHKIPYFKKKAGLASIILQAPGFPFGHMLKWFPDKMRNEDGDLIKGEQLINSMKAVLNDKDLHVDLEITLGKVTKLDPKSLTPNQFRLLLEGNNDKYIKEHIDVIKDKPALWSEAYQYTSEDLPIYKRLPNVYYLAHERFKYGRELLSNSDNNVSVLASLEKVIQSIKRAFPEDQDGQDKQVKHISVFNYFVTKQSGIMPEIQCLSETELLAIVESIKQSILNTFPEDRVEQKKQFNDILLFIKTKIDEILEKDPNNPMPTDIKSFDSIIVKLSEIMASQNYEKDDKLKEIQQGATERFNQGDYGCYGLFRFGMKARSGDVSDETPGSGFNK